MIVAGGRAAARRRAKVFALALLALLALLAVLAVFALLFLGLCLDTGLLHHHGFADDHVALPNARAQPGHPVGAELGVVRVALPPVDVGAGDLVPLGPHHAPVLVRPVVGEAPKTVVDGALADQDAVLLVLAAVAEDGEGDHLALRVLVLGRQGLDGRHDQRAAGGSPSRRGAGRSGASSFAPRAPWPACPWRFGRCCGALVVVGERLGARHQPEDDRRVDLGVGVPALGVLGERFRGVGPRGSRRRAPPPCPCTRPPLVHERLPHGPLPPRRRREPVPAPYLLQPPHRVDPEERPHALPGSHDTRTPPSGGPARRSGRRGAPGASAAWRASSPRTPAAAGVADGDVPDHPAVEQHVGVARRQGPLPAGRRAGEQPAREAAEHLGHRVLGGPHGHGGQHREVFDQPARLALRRLAHRQLMPQSLGWRCRHSVAFPSLLHWVLSFRLKDTVPPWQMRAGHHHARVDVFLQAPVARGEVVLERRRHFPALHEIGDVDALPDAEALVQMLRIEVSVCRHI